MPREPKRSLLDFPLELRTMIYHGLLSQPEAISSSSEAHLHPAILSTCRQIWREASCILHTENTFGVTVCQRYGKPRAALMGADHIGEMPTFVPGFRFEDIRRLKITVLVHDSMELWSIQAAVRKVSLALTEIRRLDYVHLRLENKDEIDALKGCFILQNFGLLRCVGKVVTEGFECVCAERLGLRMMATAPLSPLFKMYSILELHTGPFGFNNLLQAAREATMLSNADMFTKHREMIVRQLNSGMEELIRRLYEHDSQGETNHGLGIRPAVGLPSLEDPESLKNDLKDDSSDDGLYETADEGED